MALLNKLIVSGKLFGKRPYNLKNNGELVRSLTYTPPQVRVSFTEKLILGMVMISSVLAVPLWIIYHIPEYQGQRPKAAEN